MKIRDLMTANPTCAEPETTVEEIATLMKEEDIGCVPVMDEEGAVAGVITDRDIVLRCIAEGKDAAECHAEDVMSPQSVTIGPDADSREAARLMAERQIRRLPVVEQGKLVGMLSLGDVAVKENDDRLSGDVLQEVSEGVKSSSDARNVGAQLGGSRSGVKTSTADRTIAGRSSSGKTMGSQERHPQQRRSSGKGEELAEDARPTAAFDSGRAGITNDREEESHRQEKVLPFREQRDNRIRKEAMDVRDRKKTG
jgi:CBS domain-containing protein